MIETLTTILMSTWLGIASFFGGPMFGTAPFVFTSDQVGSSATNGYVLQTDGDVSTWVSTTTLGISGGSGATVFGDLSDVSTSSDATGDVYYQNSSGQITNLGIGSNGEVLKVSGGLPSWGTDVGAGAGGGTVSTSTDLVDTYVTYATAPSTIGAEAAFTYDDATDLLTVVNASTTNLTALYASSTDAHFGTLNLPNLTDGMLAVYSNIVGSYATTTFSGGLTYSNGNVTSDLGTSIDISDETNLAGDSEIVLTDDTLSIASSIARDSELHDAVTLSGTPDYITLSGQDIVRGTIDIGDDTNLSASWPLSLVGDALSWIGLATTSQPTAGQLLYSDGGTGLIPVATSSINVGTATALEANGANCASGSYALGVDASGASEGCTDATTEIDSAISTHTSNATAHQALVTLAGALDYLTLSGQEITRNAIDLATDITGTLGITNGGTGTSTPAVGGQILAWVGSNWQGVATTTFSGGLTYSNGNVTADLGTSIETGEITNGTILAVDLSTTTTFLDGEIVQYVAATDNFTSVTCAELTGSADLCDGNDASGVGGTGLATTSPIADSNVLTYSASGAGSAYGTATTSVAAGTGIASSATLGALVGGANTTLSIDFTEFDTDSITQGATNLYNQTHTGEVTGATALTIADSVAVSNWNLTTPTLTTFFGTPCTGNEFLQDISDTGAFSCAAAPAGGVDGFDFTYSTDIGYGITGSATSTKTQFTAGIHASSTSHFANASTTQLSIEGAYIYDTSGTTRFLGASTALDITDSTQNSELYLSDGTWQAANYSDGTFDFLNSGSNTATLDFESVVSGKILTIPNLTGSFALGSFTTGFLNGNIPFGSSGLLATSTGFSFNDTDDRLTATYASTTAISGSNATFTTFNGALTGNVTGNADTATALAANGANCSSGNAPLGVDASGAVEGCFDVWTEAENTSAAYIALTDLSATWPINYNNGTGAFTWGGLATTSQPTAGQILYSDGTTGLTPVSTTTATIGTGLSYSGTFGSLVGGAAGTLSVDLGTDIDISEIQAASKSGLDSELLTGTIATTNAVLTVNADDDVVEETNGLTWNITPATCTGDGNGGALTISGTEIVCSADDGGGGSGGEDFLYSQDIGYGVTGSATTTKTQFTAGIHASSTSHFSNATTTQATITDLWATTLQSLTTVGANAEGAIETAIDTLANLTSIQGFTFTLADAGTNAFFGWDDAAGAYENLTAAEALTIIGGAANDFDGSGDLGTGVVADNEIDYTQVTLADFDIDDFAGDTNDDDDLDVAAGGTGVSTFSSSQLLYGAGTGDIQTVATGTVSAGTGISISATIYALLNAASIAIDQAANLTWTGIHDFTSAVLRLPHGASPTVDANGETAIDTTAEFDQLLFYGDAKRVVTPLQRLGFAYATTSWTGTTTLNIGPAYIGSQIEYGYCETNTGTVAVSIYDGTNRADFMPTASTTINKFSYSTNNTWTEGESMRVDLGQPASSPTRVSCSFGFSVTAE